MDAIEVELLRQREAQAIRARQNYLLFLMITMAGAGAIFALLLQGIRREMLARAAADEAVRGLNADLERRVIERTAALDENQLRFIDLFEFAPAALVMADRDGLILRVNREAEAIFGWLRADLLGQSVEVLMPEDMKADYLSMRGRFELEPLPASMVLGRPHLRGLRKDGTSFPIEVSLSPLKVDENLAVLVAVHDTTERERMDEALRQSDTLYRNTLGQHAGGLPDHRLRLALPLRQRGRRAPEPPGPRSRHRPHDDGRLPPASRARRCSR